MYAGRGVLAVVCPGYGTALPATGRKWHRTSLSRARRNLAWPARPGQGGAGAFGRVQKATTAKPGRPYRDPGPGDYQPWPASSRDKARRNHGYLRSARFPGPYIGSGETTSVIDAITRRAKHEAGLPVLILKIPNNPILQSCALPDYNCGATLITTQDRAYTFCNLTKPAARCIAGLRFSANTAAARYGFVRFLLFFIEFAFLRGR